MTAPIWVVGLYYYISTFHPLLINMIIWKTVLFRIISYQHVVYHTVSPSSSSFFKQNMATLSESCCLWKILKEIANNSWCLICSWLCLTLYCICCCLLFFCFVLCDNYQVICRTALFILTFSCFLFIFKISWITFYLSVQYFFPCTLF